MYEKKHLNNSEPYKSINNYSDVKNTVYYGEVVSTFDETDGDRIKVKILELDNHIVDNNELPYSYPLLPKFLHIKPKVGEYVRVILQNPDFPQRNRFYTGSVISQPHKINFDPTLTALSTSGLGYIAPDKAPSTFPDADGVFPKENDIALLGRDNSDLILSENSVELRAGKHENNDILKLNVDNPSSLKLVYEPDSVNSDEYLSKTIMMSDKIALISHNGNPKFKSARLNLDDRDRIFDEGHPLARADVLVEILNIFRNAIIGHIHGYSKLPADKNSIINDLENIDLTSILQENIVIN